MRRRHQPDEGAVFLQAYLARINEVNSLLHAVIETAPIDVLYAEARRFDTERASKGYRGYLHGIPILVKVSLEMHKRSN